MSNSQAADEPRGLRRFWAVLVKVRQRGLSWLVERTKREMLTPTTGTGRRLGQLRAATERLWLRPRAPRVRSQDDVLYYFLDLEVCPITFDNVSYLATAELYRRRHGLASIHVVIVPGTVDGIRPEAEDYAVAVSPEGRKWRLHHVVIPLFRLMPSVSGYTICASREEARERFFFNASHIYPDGYSVVQPITPRKRDTCDAARAGEAVLPMLRATPQSLTYMRQFLEPRARGRRVIVINLRNYAFMPARNSNDASWITFASELDPKRWLPVFVFDTDTALDLPSPEFDRFVVCHAAPWNLELRMALYELADLTMSISQGPLELCWLNHRCRYATFLKPNATPQSSDAAYLAHGFELGHDLAFAGHGQRCIWESDELPIIRSVFAEMTGDAPVCAQPARDD